ncbi:hypothetical protein RclHR1_17250005 [Rhizophagus clarus]|uniref:Uncharacterized protein n=1 Tax=Rhizophagus clarus TaxID=94130 RepID=A0A2Z6QNN8_9GLOM|nr:hypothetical protein RclHR1_17250005 [Rhizophagus clarus]
MCTIFITFKDLVTCKLVKDIWSISLDDTLYRLVPANYSDTNMINRKKFSGKFIGFNNDISPAAVQDAYVTQNSKHVYQQSPNKFIIEFSLEHDLFNTCAMKVHFNNYHITGFSCNYEVNWQRRNNKLAKIVPLIIRQEEHVSSLPLTSKMKPKRSTKNLKNQNNKIPSLRQEVKINSVVTGANACELGRSNRMIKPVDITRPLDSSYSMTDNSNSQGSSSTSSTHMDGIPEPIENELAVIGQMSSQVAHSNNRMTSANQSSILDNTNLTNNSHIKNNNNIIVNNISDKEQIDQSNDSHNENSHSKELVNQCEKDVTIYLSRQRLIYEAGYQHNKNDPSHQQRGN